MERLSEGTSPPKGAQSIISRAALGDNQVHT